ncbi:MAG: c-type cytochrome [Gammaproteobacteria bacterium]|jgi:thiosulfate dehydrogenase|nr:c-type cytochrome [Gammaproteobacteria bacterium]
MKANYFLAVLLTVGGLCQAGDAPSSLPLPVPAAASLPAGPLGESIVRGRAYLAQTKERLPDFVGNGLACKNCHLGNGIEVGTEPHAGPFVGVVAGFPQYRSRDGAVNTLEQRINSCFERSLNGKPLPLDHPAMIDMVAYMTWLSQGVPVGTQPGGHGMPQLKLPRSPDLAQGKAVYQARCLACHGIDGSGLANPAGGYVFPPLWGPQSFNIAAGMARHFTAAGFIKHNMPLGQGNSLSDDEVFDVAAYVIHQDRPDFPGKIKDWPQGDKPQDARY